MEQHREQKAGRGSGSSGTTKEHPINGLMRPPETLATVQRATQIDGQVAGAQSCGEMETAPASAVADSEASGDKATVEGGNGSVTRSCCCSRQQSRRDAAISETIRKIYASLTSLLCERQHRLGNAKLSMSPAAEGRSEEEEEENWSEEQYVVKKKLYDALARLDLLLHDNFLYTYLEKLLQSGDVMQPSAQHRAVQHDSATTISTAQQSVHDADENSHIVEDERVAMSSDEEVTGPPVFSNQVEDTVDEIYLRTQLYSKSDGNDLAKQKAADQTDEAPAPAVGGDYVNGSVPIVGDGDNAVVEPSGRCEDLDRLPASDKRLKGTADGVERRQATNIPVDNCSEPRVPHGDSLPSTLSERRSAAPTSYPSPGHPSRPSMRSADRAAAVQGGTPVPQPPSNPAPAYRPTSQHNDEGEDNAVGVAQQDADVDERPWKLTGPETAVVPAIGAGLNPAVEETMRLSLLGECKLWEELKTVEANYAELLRKSEDDKPIIRSVDLWREIVEERGDTIVKLCADLDILRQLLVPLSLRSFLTGVAKYVLSMFIIFNHPRSEYGTETLDKPLIGPILCAKNSEDLWQPIKKENKTSLSSLFTVEEWEMMSKLNEHVNGRLHSSDLLNDSNGEHVVYVSNIFNSENKFSMTKAHITSRITSIVSKVYPSVKEQNVVMFV